MNWKRFWLFALPAVSLAAGSPPAPPLPALPPARARAVSFHATKAQSPRAAVAAASLGKAMAVAPPPAAPPAIVLGWTQTATNPAVFGLFHNHLLWSTNSPAGPWTGDIPVLCTNSNMVASVNVDAAVKTMFFKLGANSP